MALSETLNELAKAIRNLNPYTNPSVRIKNPCVGLKVGVCINCQNTVSLRQPWLSKVPVVNDGWYLLHCENEECHNFYGMELKDNQFDIADFVAWDECYLVENQEHKTVINDKVVSIDCFLPKKNK